MNVPLVPDDFDIPLLVETELFRLRPLTVHNVVKDFDAMMSRVDPDPTLTIEKNLADLGWHQVEFARRTSFTYTVMSLDESRCLGCVYIYPPDETTPNADACIRLWVRKSEHATGLDDMLFSTVRGWIDTAWPFKKPAYPGREAS